MANSNMSGTELDKTLKTFSNAEKPANNGGYFMIKNGKIVFVAPQTQ